MPIRTGIISAALFSLLAVGCAGAPSRPTPQITRAQTLIEQAEKAGAQQYAPTDLDHARDRLSAANEAADKGKQAVADQYASEAAADAELATARASASQARKSADELNQSLDTLRNEATRKTEPLPDSSEQH